MVVRAVAASLERGPMSGWERNVDERSMAVWRGVSRGMGPVKVRR